MKIYKVFSMGVLAAAAAVAQAQNPVQTQFQPVPDVDGTLFRTTIIPPPAPLAAHQPFSLHDGHASLVVEIRPASVLSEQDRELEANAESTIRERAGVEAFDINGGQWAYSQVACEAFPNHLFLRYTRNTGTGDVSVFSVSIPRDGNGRIRFIPLQRRGYSVFSPTPVNAMTVAVFNHALMEEHGNTGHKPDWPAMALCYAALAGAGGVQQEPVTLERPPVLNVSLEGDADVTFVTGEQRPMEWKMVFDDKGVLRKAIRSVASEQLVDYPKPVELTAIPGAHVHDVPPPATAPQQ